MSAFRGGRKKMDKLKGRGHWKGRSGIRAIELATGRSNNDRGIIIDGSSLTEGQNRVWVAREAEVAQVRQTRNQDSRRRRGKVTGPIQKPVGPAGGVPGTHHA